MLILQHNAKRVKFSPATSLFGLPNEVLLLILSELSVVDRCSFALSCKTICRLTVQNEHHFKDDDTSFIARHDFMSFISEHWAPTSLHFCFRCNQLHKVDKSVRDSWYHPSTSDDEPTHKSSITTGTPVEMTLGHWSKWTITLQNERKTVVAWCPGCVEEHTLAQQESDRKRLAAGKIYRGPCFAHINARWRHARSGPGSGSGHGNGNGGARREYMNMSPAKLCENVSVLMGCSSTTTATMGTAGASPMNTT